jgi:UDP-N-acetylglucosamine 2-epimerase (non-hydrolysing)
LTERLRLAVLTTGRQDYGILRSSLLLLQRDPRFELLVWAGGMHLSPPHGLTVRQIEADGLPIAARLPFVGEAGGPAGDCARAMEQVTRALSEQRPSALLLLGDRSETLAAGFAATLAAVPIAHLHGGEETEGAVDNAFRHALTKLSHLHLVSHERHAARVRQLGEPPEQVVVVGAAGLDNLYRTDLPDRAQLEAELGIALGQPLVLVTSHPTTLGGDPAAEAAAVAAAMERVDATYVITQPNADAGGAAIREVWAGWARGRSRVLVVDALGERRFFGLLRIADAMLGNSSSGIIEAPAAGLPVVNVGDRQRGRLRTSHVIDTPPAPEAIAAALAHALAPETHAACRAAEGPYPRGPAGPRIVDALARWQLPNPPRKRFHDLPVARGAS